MIVFLKLQQAKELITQLVVFLILIASIDCFSSGLLIKDVRKTVTNEVKEQNVRFLSLLLRTLGANILGNLLTSKDTIRSGEGAIKFGQNF